MQAIFVRSDGVSFLVNGRSATFTDFDGLLRDGAEIAERFLLTDGVLFITHNVTHQRSDARDAKKP
mgnify:CR=1 FL=1